MKNFSVYIKYSLALWGLLFLFGCTVHEEQIEHSRPGQAFTAGERRARHRGKKYWSGEVRRSKRTRLDGRAEFRSEKIIPSRLEYFQGNPHLNR